MGRRKPGAAATDDAGLALMDAVKGIAGKMLGGEQDPAAAIKAHFVSIGLTSDHLKSMLPSLQQMLASKPPPDVLQQMKQHVPGFGEAVKEEIQQERWPANR